MKEKIHPTYYPEAKVTCSCGRNFTLGSTRKEIKVELCSSCHPFYTGEQRVVDTAGRVERFKRRYEKKPVVEKKPVPVPVVAEVKTEPAPKKTTKKS